MFDLSGHTRHSVRRFHMKKPGAHFGRITVLFFVALLVIGSPDHAFAKKKKHPTPTPTPGAVIVSPVPGSTFSGPTITFQWSGAKAKAYRLALGSTSSAEDIFSSNVLRTTSTTVTGIPTDGRTVYATLSSHLKKSWVGNA